MKKSLGILWIALAAAWLPAGCNNNGTGTSFTNPVTCGLQGKTILVYPKNGAVRVPDSTTNVYIASNNNTLANGNFNTAVQPPNGLPYYFGGNFVQVPESQVPSPHAKPGFGNPTYYVSNIGPLAGASTYVIGFNVQNETCNPAGLGQFTTQ